KGNPNTGVEDVAAVAGLALVAAGAVVIAKKRK
ncbi:MAG: NPXTG-anchored protein, partial [Ruminiclostridium sp.]|nr:NPXTG-anchored protein [Ruminiclostridium sp.]MBP3855236.1 NPXTG-anchored protein [Ruminiclostridium sp.]